MRLAVQLPCWFHIFINGNTTFDFVILTMLGSSRNFSYCYDCHVMLGSNPSTFRGDGLLVIIVCVCVCVWVWLCDIYHMISGAEQELNNKSLTENSAITLGRLAWVCPELVSPHMEHFMQSWCIALSM